MKKLTVLIPTMNEAKGIADTISRIPKSELKKLGYATNVVIIDTNSTDGTPAIARKLGAKVIDEPRRGYGRAYKTAFQKVKTDVIVTMDADATYPPEEIPKLIKIFDKEELDFIVADRLSDFEAGSQPNLFLNKLSNLYIFMLYGIMFSDSQSGMWVIRTDKLNKLNPICDGWPFSPEIKIEAVKRGLRFKEVPIHFKIRSGKTKLNALGGAWVNIVFLFKKRFNLV